MDNEVRHHGMGTQDLKEYPTEIAKKRQKFAGYPPAIHSMRQDTRPELKIVIFLMSILRIFCDIIFRKS